MEKNTQSKKLAALISDDREPLLVSFYTRDCMNGVCSTQNAYLDTLEKDLSGVSVRFAQIDLDESPELVEEFQITSLPCALLFVDGEMHTRMSGLTDPGVLACAILRQVEDGSAVMARSGHICPITHAAA